MNKKVRLEVDYIRPNSTLIYPIYSDGGDKILSEREVISSSMLNEIKKKYGNYVYYNDSPERSAVPPFRMNIALNQSHDVMQEVGETGKLSRSRFREAEKVVEEIVTDLTSTDIEVVSLLKGLKSMDEYVYNHSVNVGILTGVFAKILGYTMDEMKDLTMGGYLLDIGHMMLDKQLVNKEGRYTISERQKMKRHPQLGYEVLKNITGISPVVLQAVLFHHERFNSEGYYQMPYENLPCLRKLWVSGICLTLSHQRDHTGWPSVPAPR